MDACRASMGPKLGQVHGPVRTRARCAAKARPHWPLPRRRGRRRRRTGQHLQSHLPQVWHLLARLHKGEAKTGAGVDLVVAGVAAEDGAARGALEVLRAPGRPACSKRAPVVGSWRRAGPVEVQEANCCHTIRCQRAAGAKPQGRRAGQQRRAPAAVLAMQGRDSGSCGSLLPLPWPTISRSCLDVVGCRKLGDDRLSNLPNLWIE